MDELNENNKETVTKSVLEIINEFEKAEFAKPNTQYAIGWSYPIAYIIIMILMYIILCTILFSQKVIDVSDPWKMTFILAIIIAIFVFCVICIKSFNNKNEILVLNEKYKYRAYFLDVLKRIVVENVRHGKATEKKEDSANSNNQPNKDKHTVVELSQESITILANSIKSLFDQNKGDVKLEDVNNLIKTILSNNNTTNVTFIK